MTADLDEPLVFEHAHQGWWDRPAPYRQAFTAWMRETGIEPDDTISIAVYLIDAPFAQVVQYVKDEAGRSVIDYEREEFVTATMTVPLTTLPPRKD